MNLIKRTLTILLCAAMVITYMPLSMITAYAEAGDTPEHRKSITDNHNGTYKLELSVTGDADNETQEAGAVNVLVVYDTSSSMTSNAGTSRYSRADQAEDVVHDFLTNLATYQNQDENNINVGLVTFARYTNQHNQGQGWTTNVTGLANRFDDGGTDTRVNFSYSGTQSNGTNWEAALDLADDMVGNAPGRGDIPTFVVMITDGACTASGNGNNAINPSGGTIAQFRNFYNAATDDARSTAVACEATGGTFYGIYAYGTEADLLDDLMYFSVNNRHRDGNINNVRDRTDPAPNYFNAGETAQLQAAIDEIFDKVVQAMGISSVVISDGTTHQVETSTGDIAELLEVDTDSYQYWISIPVVGGKFSRVDRDGNTIEYTVTDNQDGTCTVTWRDGSNNAHTINVDGSVSGGQFKYEWTKANDLYNYNPPIAKLNGSSVDWNLSSVGTLLDGVTYSVTFDVYPSQTALDYKARLENGEAYTTVVPEAAREYFNNNGELETNTTATLTYSDTRLSNPGPTTVGFDNPDSVTTKASQMTVKKEWEGDSKPDYTLSLDILMDGDEEHPFYVASVSNSNSWQSTFNISCGLIKEDSTGYKVLEGSEGHDFSFAELDDTQYRWELHAPTVRPMIINGADEPTMLIKADAENGYDPGDKKTYVIEGETYYVDPSAAKPTATNHRRSNLNLRKVVTGEGADPDTDFPFTLKVNNIKAPTTEPTDDPGHNSDYWVWFSIADFNDLDEEGYPKTVTEGITTNAHDNGNGYYYAPSGTNITVNMKDGWGLRFTNLPSGSTYEFTEGEAEGFKLVSAKDTGATDSSFTFSESERKAKGTVQTYNGKAYEATFTNDYAKVNVSVKKVWVDDNDRDGIRPDNLTLTLSPAVEGATPNITKNTDNTWTYTWSNLPKYDSNNAEIEYTVTEQDEPEGYSCTDNTAGDGESIINVHKPEETEFMVQKVWKDVDDADDIRPDAVHVQLKADGEAYLDPVALNDENHWVYSWKELPANKNDSANNDSTEQDSDNTDPEAERKSIATDDSEVENPENEETPAEEEVKAAPAKEAAAAAPDEEAEKAASAEENAEASAEGEAEKTPAAREEAGKAGENDAALTKGATKIVYTVDEVKEGVITGVDGKATYAYEIDPIYDPDDDSIIIGYLITNIHTPQTQINGKKIWNDNNDEDDTRPETITVSVYKDVVDAANLVEGFAEISIGLEGSGADVIATEGENGVWNFIIDGLTKYEYDKETGEPKTDPETGKPIPIIYVIAEETINGYITTYSDDTYTITNTETTEIEVEKTWVNNDGSTTWPEGETVTVQLTADGEDVEGKTVTLSADKTSDKFTSLAKYKADGTTPIEYGVKEFEVAGYTTEIGELKDGKITIKNTQKTTKVEATKVWDDNDNQDGKRDDVTFDLYAGNTKLADQSKKISKDATDEDLTVKWEDLPAYDGDTKIAYTVKEAGVDANNKITMNGDEYTVTITGDAENGFIITNKHETEKMSLSITKTWDDSNDQDGKRSSVDAEVTLYKTPEGGQKAAVEGDIAVPTKNGTVKTWTNLPVYEGGKKITYSVEETMDETVGYTAQIGDAVVASDGANATIAVTNKYTPEVKKINGVKTWNDDEYTALPESAGYERPASVTVTITGEIEGGITVPLKSKYGIEPVVTTTEAKQWKYGWENLPVYHEGKPISYSITEELPNGYSYINEEANPFNLINTPVEKELIVDPVRIKKLDSITGEPLPGAIFTLKDSDGKVVATATSSETGEGELEIIKEGTYTLTETAPEGYTSDPGSWTIEVSKSGVYKVTYNTDKKLWSWFYHLLFGDDSEYKDGVLTVPNTPAMTKVTANKVWNDNNDKDKKRPTEIELTLTGTAGTWTTTDTKIVKADSEGNWKYTWENLAGYHNGTKISYSVTEKAIPEYKTKYDPASGVSGDVTNGYSVKITNSRQSKPVKDVVDVVDNKKVSIDGNTVKPGDVLNYEITYVNTTGETVDKVVITDEISKYTTYNNDADQGGTFADGVVTWTFEEVADGTPITVKFSVTVKDDVSGETIVNKGVVDADGTKLDTNEVTNPTPPKKTAYTGGTKVLVDGDVVQPNEEITYEIKYTNTSGVKLEKVEITDTIPDLTELVDNGGATVSGKTLKWTLENVENGKEVTVKFVVRVKSDVAGETITNQANVVTDNNKFETNEVSNPTPPKKEVFAEADAAMKTNIDGQEVKAGDVLTYKITYNNTTKDTVNAVITDNIPDYTTYVEDSQKSDPAGAAFTEKDGELKWTADVATGKSLTVTFQVKVDETTGGQTVENIGKIRNGENGSVIETNPVKNPVTTELVITKDLKNFVDHGNNVKATFAFQITGTSATRGEYKNVVAMEFSGAGTDKLTVKGIPSDIKNLKVEEIVSGNYTPSTEGVKLDQADGKYKVTFTNTYDDTGYKTGTINNYKRGTDGKYTSNGTGNRTPGDTAADAEGGPGDEPVNN